LGIPPHSSGESGLTLHVKGATLVGEFFLPWSLEMLLKKKKEPSPNKLAWVGTYMW